MRVDIDCKLGARIKDRRNFLCMSIEEVASNVNLSPGYLSLVEQGRRSLEFEELGVLMEVLQVNFDDLVDEEELLLEQGIRDSFERFNKEDLKIVLTVCNSLISSKKESLPRKFICLYKQEIS